MFGMSKQFDELSNFNSAKDEIHSYLSTSDVRK